MMLGPKKTKSILFRCSEEDYECIRNAALAEHRTLSGFLLDAALKKVREAASETKALDQQPQRISSAIHD